MDIKLPKLAPFLLLPLFYFSVLSIHIGYFRRAGIFRDTVFSLFLFYFIYIICFSVFDDFNCMTILRFRNMTAVLKYYYKKSLPYTFIYVLYMAIIFVILSELLSLPFVLKQIVAYILFNCAALLILNLICIVICFKHDSKLSKATTCMAVLVMLSGFNLMSISGSPVCNYLKMLSIIQYYSFTQFTSGQMIMIPFVYASYILISLYVFYFIKRDIL